MLPDPRTSDEALPWSWSYDSEGVLSAGAQTSGQQWAHMVGTRTPEGTLQSGAWTPEKVLQWLALKPLRKALLI